MHRILKIWYLFWLLFCITLAVHAQERNLAALPIHKKYALACRLIDEKSYYNAIEILKELVVKDSTQKKYVFKLAECHYLTRNYQEALKWYPKLNENLVKKGKKNKDKEAVISIATFHQAECLKNTGNYEEARLLFELFSNSNYRDVKGMNVKALAKNEIKSCEFAIKRKRSDIDVSITHMGGSINSAYSDFAPTLKDDNTLIFSSYKADSVIKVPYGEKHTEHVKIYESDYEAGSWTDPKEIEPLTPSHGHSSGGTFSTDKRRFYFSRCRTKQGGAINCKIYVASLDSLGNFVGKPKKLKGPINYKVHSSSQPVYATRKKGKTTEEGIYFVSNMRGSIGGTDIWYAQFDKEGQISALSNCGRAINTIRDECAPYYDVDAGSLYFSSNYHPGYGGFDIFKSKGWNTKWQRPENLKLPVNSSYDDLFFTLLPENKLEGFLTTNRPGGTALTHATCCEDIWKMSFKIPNILVAQAIDSATGEVLKDALLVEGGTFETASDSAFNADASIDYDTVFTNEDEHFLRVIKAKQKIPTYYIIGSSKKVVLSARKSGYLPVRVWYTTDSLTQISDVVADKGSFVSEKKENISKITLLMVRGEEQQQVAAPIAKVDTVKSKSTLKEQFTNSDPKINEPKVDVFVGDTTKPKVIEEIDFNINLSFEYKAVGLNKQNTNTLDSLVAILKSNNNIQIAFTTHTDGIGSDEYNLELSKKRAAFLADYLIKKGIARKRIREATGVGERQPLYKETFSDGSDNEEARKLNRRTEIRFYFER